MMTITTPPRPGSAGTADRLIEAAISVIEQDGDAAVRVRDVAGAAGVTYSAVQFHFGGREGLVEAAYLELYRRDLLDVVPAFADWVAGLRDVAEFTDMIRSVAPTYLTHDRAGARRRRAQVLGAAATRPALAAALGEIHRQFVVEFAAALTPAQRLGWIDPDLDLPSVAAIYIGIVNARFLVESGDTEIDPERWNHAAVTALLGFTVSSGDRANSGAPRV